jgi:phage gpG-like protein
MAGYAIKLEARQARRYFADVAKRALDMTAVYRDIGEHMLRSVEKNFSEEGRPDAWATRAPLASKTLIRKVGGVRRAMSKRGGLKAKAARKLAGNKILTDTGRLRRSITYRARRDHVMLGTNVVYARAHQFGVPGRLPARPFLMVQPEDLLKFKKIVAQHIMGAFRR